MKLEFLVIMFLLACLYSSVGHGGASGYLALMSLFSIDPSIMRPTALILNLLVSGIAFWQFYRKGFFQWRLFWPFIIGSVPAAFLGGMIHISTTVYKPILGFLLLIAIVRIFIPIKDTKKQLAFSYLAAIAIGAIIGLLSGMIGIGGGIILSPVILLLGWADIRETAAISALFIWINSFAGLLGFFTVGGRIDFDFWILIVIVAIGALIGGYFGSFKWNLKYLKTSLSIVLLMASLKLIFL